jgi:hypothetical protein
MMAGIGSGLGRTPYEVRTPKRIGVLLCARDVNEAALSFLVLCMNCQQESFQYEFLPPKPDDEFLNPLYGTAELHRDDVRAKARSFCQQYRDYLVDFSERYKLREPPPGYFVAITTARFTDNYYSMREGDLSIIALGNWKRGMAPPSLLEFVLTLLVREAVAAASRSLRSSIHLGTKGCLFDFTPHLSEVRQKVLHAFICAYCRAALEADGLPELASELESVLGRQWLGTPTEPSTPAGIASNLGYNLFVTKGLKATPWEAFKSTVRQESATQLVTVAGVLLVAVLLVVLGLK